MEKTSSMPIFIQLADRIKSMIKSGELNPGAMLPTEIEYAKSLGVSRSTLRNTFDILEREGFIERRKSKGTVISELARHNKHLHPDLAIVTRLDLTEPKNFIPFFDGSDETASMLAAATKRGILVRFVPWCAENGRFDLDEILFTKGIDGYVFVSPLYLTDFIDRVLDAEIPHVLLESHYDKRGVNTVMNDDAFATEVCLDKLMEIGHSKIAFCGGPLKRPEFNSSSRRTRDAFLQAAAERSLFLKDEWVLGFGESLEKNVQLDPSESLKRLLSLPDRPSAIICSTYRIAATAKLAAAELGITVPGDLSLVAAGGREQDVDAPFSGCVKNYTLIGEKAVNSLLEWFVDIRYAPVCRKIPPTYNDAGTVAPPFER